MPDVVSHDASPDTMAQRMELANLISEAAGGLSDRDQAVLELAYRQGLDGPELAQALGVSQTNANTMVGRLRDTIERSLGALLVARRIQAEPARCPELASVLHGWDGKFNILMRKRIARHIESCAACEDLRSRSVSPRALLGAAPLLIPAPSWLKDRVMLTSASRGLATTLNPRVDESDFHAAPTAARPAIQPPPYVRHDEPAPLAEEPREDDKRRVVPLIAILIGVPLVVLGATLAWLYLPSTALAPSGIVGPAPAPTPSPSISGPTAALNPVLPPPKARPGAAGRDAGAAPAGTSPGRAGPAANAGSESSRSAACAGAGAPACPACPGACAWTAASITHWPDPREHSRDARAPGSLPPTRSPVPSIKHRKRFPRLLIRRPTRFRLPLIPRPHLHRRLLRPQHPHRHPRPLQHPPPGSGTRTSACG